jgi:hypothetical protein
MSKYISKYDSKTNYTKISNLSVIDERLSNAALGLLLRILRNAHVVEIDELYRAYINKQCPKDATATITKQLKELRASGYARLEEFQDKTGKFKSRYWFSEISKETWIKIYNKQEQERKKRGLKSMRTQKKNGSFHFYESRHKTPTAEQKSDTSPQKRPPNHTQIWHKDLLKYTDRKQKTYQNHKAAPEKLISYCFAVQVICVYNFYLSKYHNKDYFTFSTAHTDNLQMILESINDELKVSTGAEPSEQSILIHFAFMLETIQQEFKTRGEIYKFFPGLLRYAFDDIWANYVKKRKAYLTQHKYNSTPEFVRIIFNNEPEIQNEVLKQIGF